MADMREMGPIRVSVDEANRRHDEHGATFLDVVDTGPYEQIDRQIAGAVRIAPEKVQDEYDQLPQDKAVFAYCT